MVRVVLPAFLLSGFIALAASHPQSAQKDSPAQPPSGTVLYKEHCARCHGASGRGDGHSAEALSMQPTDLTQLTAKNGGKFPTRRVEQTLGGSDGIPAHGRKQMPVWGPALKSSDDARAIISYLESIQRAP